MTGQPKGESRDPRIERSRTLILDAAVALLTEGGAAALTIEAITTRSGVARSTLYRHFATSNEVVAAAFARSLPAQVPPSGETMRERLLALVRQQADLVERAILSPVDILGWMATLDGTAAPDSAASARAPHAQALRRTIREYFRGPFESVLRDELGVAELATEEQADAVTAQLIGPLLFNALVSRSDVEPLCERIVDDFLANR